MRRGKDRNVIIQTEIQAFFTLALFQVIHSHIFLLTVSMEEMGFFEYVTT